MWDLVKKYGFDVIIGTTEGLLDVQTALLICVIVVGSEHPIVSARCQPKATLVETHLSPASACSKFVQHCLEDPSCWYEV